MLAPTSSSVAEAQGAVDSRAMGGPGRRALLVALRRADGPVDAGTAGAAVGLHTNTARVHLELLCSLGLARRSTEQRPNRGRPRVLYAAADGHADGPTPPCSDDIYSGLALVLSRQEHQYPEVVGAALRAGRRWAAGMGVDDSHHGARTPAEAVVVLTTLLDRLGFGPEADPQLTEVRLHDCPFRGLPADTRAVLCGVHLGMLKTTLEQLQLPLEVSGLDASLGGGPVRCRIRLAVPAPGTRRVPPAGA